MENAQLTPDEHIRLWNDFREGNEEAFSKLYELFAADLYRYGYNLVRNKQIVEDCLHELFLHLYNKRNRLGPTNNIRFYLYRTLRRRLLDSVSRLQKYDSEDYLFDSADFTIQPFENQLIEEQTLSRQKQLVVNELNNLPKRQKEILYLVYLEGLSYQDAAEIMDITMKTVYNSINVALTTLRNYLNKSFEREGILWTIIASIATF